MSWVVSNGARSPSCCGTAKVSASRRTSRKLQPVRASNPGESHLEGAELVELERLGVIEVLGEQEGARLEGPGVAQARTLQHSGAA